MQYVNSGVLQLTGDFMAQVLKGKRDATGRLLIPMKSKPFNQLESLLEVISPLRVCQPLESMEADRPQKEKSLPGGFKLHVSASAGVPDAATEDIWNNLKIGLLKTTEEVCGTTRPHRWRRETWWWNEHVGEVITAKQQAFKA